MPCRDRRETLKINLRITGRLNPSHPCRVPARICQPITNSLILLTKFCDNRIFTPGPGRHDLGTDSTKTRQHAGIGRVYGGDTSPWPGTCPRFSRPKRSAVGHLSCFSAPEDRYKQVKRRSTLPKFSTRGDACEPEERESAAPPALSLIPSLDFHRFSTRSQPQFGE
jgi:hypothetical protein